MLQSQKILAFLAPTLLVNYVHCQWNDICGLNNGKRFYLENGESGSLMADFKNNVQIAKSNGTTTYKRCTVEFVTCPSCVVHVQFRFLNISRNCGKASVLDSCGCDYLWIYEPPIEDASGEQFCGRFLKNNISELTYIGQTRTVAFSFVYSNEYGHAFTLDYYTKRNRIHIIGQPKIGNMNNASQFITSPFFPHLYTKDLSVEYLIECEFFEPCRISILFTDFLIDESSIVEIFDWNGQRMYVFAGNIFRPPVILSNGPAITIRFYANGASDYGFKASYSFILGILNDTTFKPNIGCGGYVNNLGGGITMMNMVDEGTKLFDCVWLIKPPENLLHRKTHLYVKVAEFINFAGTTELTIRQGLTSNQPSIEILRHPMAHYNSHNIKEHEHVVPIRQGFYISLRGVFMPETRLAIVYAAFNYKDCFGASDFLCHNLRCIPILLNCDGFDHCGDNSDESSTCSQDPKDHREYSKIPNFLFPKTESYSDITTATFVFLTCSFGLIGIILAMALLLYRVNVRERHHRQIQDHIETIHAILEESVVDIEEELVVPDEPPDYEPPPEYNELVKMKFCEAYGSLSMDNKENTLLKLCDTTTTQGEATNENEENNCHSVASTSRSCQTTPVRIPQSPPPAYANIDRPKGVPIEDQSNIVYDSCNETNQPGPSVVTNSEDINSLEQAIKYLENLSKLSSNLITGIKKGISNCKSTHFLRNTMKALSSSEENLVRSFSDSELMLNTKMSCWPSVGSFNFKKSFSTDDLTNL